MILSERDRSVYAAVREAARDGRRATVTKVSMETGVPRSSVAQVAKKLGYAGWTDMVMRLMQYFADAEQRGYIPNSVDVVVSALRKCRGGVVLVDAIGDAEICIDYVVLRLCELGFRAMPFGYGIVDEQMRSVSSGILVVINESGMSLLPACAKAASAGMRIAAITASHDTPISKISQVNVVIKNSKSLPENYQPNYFTAGVLAFMERVFSSLGRS